MQASLFNQEGKETRKIDLSAKVFGVAWNADMVHQVVNTMLANQRMVTAHAKNRGEVSGGGKKPWKQKGTGRARHGSTRSPIWRHGGVTHGPRNDKVYAGTINKKMKTKALFAILSAKLRDGELLFIDQLSLDAPKTKAAQLLVNRLATIPGYTKLSYKKGSRALIAFPAKDDTLHKSFRNMPAITADEVRNLNPVDALKYQYLVIVDPEKSVAQLEAKLA